MSRDHLDDELLLEILNHPEKLVRADQEHLDVCSHCKSRLDMYGSIQSVIRDASDTEVPPDWAEQQIRAFDPAALRDAPPPSETFASLVFDSLLTSGQDLRSAPAPVRHLVWYSPDFRIDLMIKATGPDQHEIVGQISTNKRTYHPDVLLGTIVEVRVGQATYSGKVNVIGEFAVPLRRADAQPLEVRFRFQGRPALVVVAPW